MTGHPVPPLPAELTEGPVCVAGLGVAGRSAARFLALCGVPVVAVDARDRADEREVAADLRALGADVRLGAEAAGALPQRTTLVVTSPGWRPDQPLLVAAAHAGVPVWGDVELAWRVRRTDAPWLGVTGTNGKTTTVQMLESILRTGGLRAVACGNVGLPVLDAVLADDPYDVLAVEVSSFQLHWTRTVEFRAAAILNIAPDHIDWHGSLEAYAEDKARVWRGASYAVYNADDPVVSELARQHDDTQDFTIGPIGHHCLGVQDGLLLDRCYGLGPDEMQHAYEGADGADGAVLAGLEDVRPPAPHNVANALAAAGLARALGLDGVHRVPIPAIAEGLRRCSPGAHRIAHVATVDGVDYVDDSKATNPHAATASMRAFADVVWVAGGLAKGATFDEVVAGAAGRLRGVVLMGQDRALVAEALERHAPEVPVVEVSRTDTGAMDDVVRAAAGLAEPGHTVLLAPACASMDMFRDYAARGDAFAAAVRRLAS
ncbi:MAG TPA: UDP-N-acetylmuramoyl-L-alanine--D-glutamate ligase [Actinomycetes bacterium]|nr:UDP-N-acetylmuramoyl-L-alanine--D-glutamate ligase [Actinomycetes bacterium]